MALKDILKLHDASLEATYSTKPVDATKVRKAFIKSLNDAQDQLESGRTKVPNRMWSVANGVVKFEPKFKGKAVPVAGETTLFVHQEHFAEAIKYITVAVEAGELDDVLLGSEGSTVPAKKSGTRAPSSDPLTGIRRSVGKSLTNGKALDEIEAALLAGSKYDAADVKAVIAERKAAGAK